MPLQFGSKIWQAVRDGKTRFNAAYFNPIWDLIDKRIADLEETKISADAEVAKLTTIGLERIDSVLAPAYLQVTQASELGFLVAPSNTVATLANNVEVSLFLDPDRKNLFAPTPYVEAARVGSAGAYAYAQVISYTRATGELRIKPQFIAGDLTNKSDWIVSASAGVWTRTGQSAGAILQAAQDTLAAAIMIQGGPVSSVAGLLGVDRRRRRRG